MVLRPKPSRALTLWWWALHGLLVSAAALVGWPWPLKVLGAAFALAHGVWRRPAGSPQLILVAADGACSIPEWGGNALELTARTRLSPYWLELGLGMGPRRHDILLLADQIDREEWARLRAILERARSSADEA